MVGKNIHGYEVLEYIGKGQFGTVYKCSKSQSIYAIKIFNIEYVNEEFSKGGNNRIIREIESLKLVKHENVIKFIDSGTFDNNKQTYVYIVMEYLEGIDLKSYLDTKRINLADAELFFAQILEGLDAIHKNNIVHRDLKPQNIYLTKNKQIKILDFGLSKMIDFTSITSTGTAIGSPLYMSPEQLKDSKNIDYRSDYYALGIILFEMMTKSNPYGQVFSREQLFQKILSDHPLSVLQFDPAIPNYLDNLIFHLLKKSNYQRPNSKEDIIKYFSLNQNTASSTTFKEYEPNFFLRVWNEKSALIDFYKNGFKIDNAIFPINHQNQQKNLLKHLQSNSVNFFIDPATMRLAYDTFLDVKGLVELPYSPKDYSRLELDDLEDLDRKKTYIKLVVEEQLKHNPSFIVAPFHVSNNSNLVSIKNASSETWFSLDVKLLKETYDYIRNNNIDKKLIGGFCVKADVLTAKTEKEFFLNVLSSLPCEMYWIYVDSINNDTGKSQLFNYISTLLELQKSTNKPVIAGRVGSIGLLLLTFGLYAFESGAGRFDTFYEDLYKDTQDAYNMYVMYYIPELLKNIPIDRKDPSKIINILKERNGVDIKCTCPYCIGKSPEELNDDPNTKKHFLYVRQKEINMLRSMGIPERIDYMEKRIQKAVDYYKKLSPIFKDSEYSFLKVWLDIIPDLRKLFQL